MCAGVYMYMSGYKCALQSIYVCFTKRCGVSLDDRWLLCTTHVPGPQLHKTRSHAYVYMWTSRGPIILDPTIGPPVTWWQRKYTGPIRAPY